MDVGEGAAARSIAMIQHTNNIYIIYIYIYIAARLGDVDVGEDVVPHVEHVVALALEQLLHLPPPKPDMAPVSNIAASF